MPHSTKTKLEALTVVRLRALAKKHKLRVGGRKAELINRILEAVGGTTTNNNGSSSSSSSRTRSKSARHGTTKTACRPPEVLPCCTVVQLRARLRKIKSFVSGNKAELMARLHSLAHLEASVATQTAPQPAGKRKRTSAGSSKTPCVVPDQSCTVAQLRALLAKQQRSTTGKKSALIERLQQSAKSPQPQLASHKRSALKGSRNKAALQAGGPTHPHFSKLRFDSLEERKHDDTKMKAALVACPTYTDSRKAKRVMDRASLRKLAMSGPHFTTQLCSGNAPILYAEPNTDEPCCRPRVFATDPTPSKTIDKSPTMCLSKKGNATFAKSLRKGSANATTATAMATATTAAKSKKRRRVRR